MSNVVTLQTLKENKIIEDRKLSQKLNKLTNQFIDSTNPDLEESKDIINEELQNNNSDLKNIIKSRNEYLEIIDKIPTDYYVKNMTKALAQTVAAQSCDINIRSNVIINLSNELAEKDNINKLLSEELIKNNTSTEDVQKILNTKDMINIKVSRKGLKDILKQKYK